MKNGMTMLNRDVPYLPEVDVPNGACILYRRIKELVASQIRRKIAMAWEEIVQGVPRD